MLISIIIPVYNEEKRVYKAVNALNKYLPRQKFKSEVLFVNDGSTDKTLPKVRKSKCNFIYKIISYKTNQGKGYAIRKGVLEAKGDYILFMDADMSTPIESLDDFLPHIYKKIPVIIGTRHTKRAEVLVRQNMMRENMGKAYTLLANLILGSGVSDFTCGFKCFSKSSAKNIFTNLKIKRWSFDAEVIFLAYRLQFRIKEVPVVWMNDSNSKVNLWRDIIGSFFDLIKIRFYYFLK